LANPVGSSASFGPLVPEIGCTSLLPSGCLATRWTAIALASVAMATDAEDGGTGTTAARSENHLGHDDFLSWHHTTPEDRMMCAGGADDDELPLVIRQEFRKLRFQMIDDIEGKYVCHHCVEVD
jgi:hypothetical protein